MPPATRFVEVDDNEITYDDENLEEVELDEEMIDIIQPQDFESTPHHQGPNRPMGAQSGPSRSLRAQAGPSGTAPGRHSPTSSTLSETAQQSQPLPTIAEQLARERQWRIDRENANELSILQARRHAIQAGDLTQDYIPIDLAKMARPSRVPVRQPALPKPNSPPTYNGSTRLSYDEWSDSCEHFFQTASESFPHEEDKVSFATQYINQYLKDSWKSYVEGQKLENPLYVVNWRDLQEQMLNALGSKEERTQDAYDRLKVLSQGNGTPTVLLNKLKSLWREVGKSQESERVHDFVSALNPRIKTIWKQNGGGIFDKVTDVEAAANRVWRTIHKDGLDRSGPVNANSGSPPSPRTRGNGGVHKRGKSVRNGPSRDNKPKEFNKGPTPNEAKSMADVECYGCHKKGHTRDYCPENPQATYGAKRNGTNQSKKGKGNRS
jgi:hypothetical protein